MVDFQPNCSRALRVSKKHRRPISHTEYRVISGGFLLPTRRYRHSSTNAKLYATLYGTVRDTGLAPEASATRLKYCYCVSTPSLLQL